MLTTATHIPILIDALMLTDGNILEMGCGYYSTLIIHNICRHTKRKITSLETDNNWLKKFIDLKTDWHDFRLVENWDDFDLTNNNEGWDLVFCDHSPGEKRKDSIRSLRDYANYIVVHDTENDPRANYQFESVFPEFKYQWTFKRYKVHTTILSNKYKLEKFYQ